MKPPYIVPTMAEIRAIPWNGRVVCSTFAGGGGSSTGYRMAGYRVLWANEFIPAAQDTYRANKADYTILDGRDIRQVKGADIEASIGMSGRDIDIFDGSPPCAAFSTAGKREAGWGKVKQYSDTQQRVDDLFFEYARLVRELQPRTFVAENVSGLVKGTAKGYFLEILAALKACGYRVKAQVLDAQWLGVPQSRSRLIFIGVRNDLLTDPVHPTPSQHWYTIRDVAPEIKAITGRTGSGFLRVPSEVTRPMNSIMVQDPAQTRYEVATENGTRRLTISEVKGFCSFPTDYILTGTYEQQWERMGRAVPPLMMKAIAEAVYKEILCRVS